MESLIKELHSLVDSKRLESSKRFFKTSAGDYAENDIFIGISVPNIRLVAKKYFNKIDSNNVVKLLHSKVHEERHLALFILVQKFEKAKSRNEKGGVFNLYMQKGNMLHINNWDLVDCSCYKIIGAFLEKEKMPPLSLYELAKNENMWFRRIAIVSTLAFIKKGSYDATIEIAKMLLYDKEDLIQKAVGWMLKEIGDMNKQVLLTFLDSNFKRIPSVMLRCATEKLSIDEKQRYKK